MHPSHPKAAFWGCVLSLNGADSITDLDLRRHGGMGRLFTGIRAPSTSGGFLRLLSFGHVRQLDAVEA